MNGHCNIPDESAKIEVIVWLLIFVCQSAAGLFVSIYQRDCFNTAWHPNPFLLNQLEKEGVYIFSKYK